MYYNSFQYSLRVWLTSAFAIPHIYLLYFMVTNTGGYFPVTGYLELLLETVLLSMPVWFLFMIILDKICEARMPLKIKKLLAWAILELLLLLLFTVIINSLGDRRMSWASCFDFVVICSFTIAVCVYLYKLKPITDKKQKLYF